MAGEQSAIFAKPVDANTAMKRRTFVKAVGLGLFGISLGAKLLPGDRMPNLESREIRIPITREESLLGTDGNLNKNLIKDGSIVLKRIGAGIQAPDGDVVSTFVVLTAGQKEFKIWWGFEGTIPTKSGTYQVTFIGTDWKTTEQGEVVFSILKKD